MDDPTQTQMWEEEKDDALNGNMAEVDEKDEDIEVEVDTTETA